MENSTENKTSNRNILDDRRVVLVASLIIAALLWIVIAGFINPGDSRPLQYVVIDYTYKEDLYKNKNLQLVGNAQEREQYAEVEVTGDGSIIGQLNPTSVTVYPDYSVVTGAGTFQVRLLCNRVSQGQGSVDYNISKWSVLSDEHSLDNNPVGTVTLTFEEVTQATFPVEVQAEGISAAAGFFVDTPTARPTEINIAGPKTEVDRIAKVVTRVEAEEELEELTRYSGVPLVLLDAIGNELDPAGMGITLSAETAEVEINVLEIRTMRLAVGFIGLPTDVDERWFNDRVHLSTSELQVVGTPSAFENADDPIIIKTFDVTQLEMGWESSLISIELPEGLRNHDQMRQVTASFDTAGLVEKTFEIASDGMAVINGPRNAVITPMTETMSVRVLGDEDQVNALLDENIVIQIDASGVSGSKGGQQAIPARVLVPGADKAFAVGTYSIVCDVRVISSAGADDAADG